MPSVAAPSVDLPRPLDASADSSITKNGISTSTASAIGTSKPLVFDSVEDTVAAFAAGSFVIILDSPSRENEGDLMISASDLTTSKSSFLIRHTSGYICVSLPASTLSSRLALPPMVAPADAQDPNRTAYTVTVDANHPDISTGISAHDRALTARMLADPTAGRESFRRPGHVVPLAAREGGVRERRGHTEAGLDLCRLAGKEGEATVLCEIVRDGEQAVEGGGVPELVGGGMMRGPELVEFGRRWGIKVCTIEDMVVYMESKYGRWEGGAGVDY